MSVGSLRNWLGLNASRASGTSARPSNVNSRTTLGLEQELNQKFEADKRVAYVVFLLEKAKYLRANLAAVEYEIERLTTERSVAE